MFYLSDLCVLLPPCCYCFILFLFIHCPCVDILLFHCFLWFSLFPSFHNLIWFASIFVFDMIVFVFYMFDESLHCLNRSAMFFMLCDCLRCPHVLYSLWVYCILWFLCYVLSLLSYDVLMSLRWFCRMFIIVLVSFLLVILWCYYDCLSVRQIIRCSRAFPRFLPQVVLCCASVCCVDDLCFRLPFVFWQVVFSVWFCFKFVLLICVCLFIIGAFIHYCVFYVVLFLFLLFYMLCIIVASVFELSA